MGILICAKERRGLRCFEDQESGYHKMDSAGFREGVCVWGGGGGGEREDIGKKEADDNKRC